MAHLTVDPHPNPTTPRDSYPVNGLGNDLTAYRATLLEADRAPTDAASQAAGYLDFALHHYARVVYALRAFQHAYGGHWLLSDEQAEQDVADAVYRISWHTPMNERDDSYLRTLLDDHGAELHAFLTQLGVDPITRDIGAEWRDWARHCECRWELGKREGSAPFPTSREHPGISGRCQLHAVVAACADYCLLIDDDWRRIADWYRLPTRRPIDITAEQLYQHHIENQGKREVAAGAHEPDLG